MKLQLKLITVFFILAALTVCVTGCFEEYKAPPKITCALLLKDDSDTQEDVPPRTKEYVYDKIEEALTKRTDLKILDRSKVEAIKKEHAFNMSDYSIDAKKTAEFGHSLGAELLCFVSVYNDERYKVEFLHVNTWQKKTVNGTYTKKTFSKKIDYVSVSELGYVNLRELIDDAKESDDDSQNPEDDSQNSEDDSQE